jgi:hypothetical protein
MKKQINEEINSMKFLLNYKRGVVISEQTTQQTPEKDIVDKIILATGNQYSLGTNEDDFMKALSLIKDKQTYDKVNSYFANNPFNNYKSIVDILNGELESDNLARAVQAKEYLKNVGLILSYSVRDKDRYGRPLAAKSLIPGTFKIGVSSSSKTNTTPPKTTTQTPPKVTTPKTNTVKKITNLPVLFPYAAAKYSSSSNISCSAIYSEFLLNNK